MTYPYPSSPLGRSSVLSVFVLLFTLKGIAAPLRQNYFHSALAAPHNSRSCALYDQGTVQEYPLSGYVRRTSNGDLVITVPSTASGRYKIRFFDDKGLLLFEIRQIKDTLLIVEKYNFEHAGQFHYELYRDTLLVEKNSFIIQRE